MTSAFNTQLNLPLHPSQRHPLTGEPLRAIFRGRNGRLFWPVIGADDPPENETPEQKAAREKADADKNETAEQKAAREKAEADAKQQKVNDAGNAIDDQGRDLGFPGSTPVKEMKPEQQAAYHSHQSKKHEGRSKEWLGLFDGKKPDEVKKELEELRREKMTEAERKVDDAKKGGATEASTKAARSMLELALDHVDEERRMLLVSSTDVSSVIDTNGDIDTGKVKRLAEALAPKSGKGDGEGPDLGQGRRRSQGKGGIEAGKSLFEQRRGKKSTSTSTDS